MCLMIMAQGLCTLEDGIGPSRRLARADSARVKFAQDGKFICHFQNFLRYRRQLDSARMWLGVPSLPYKGWIR